MRLALLVCFFVRWRSALAIADVLPREHGNRSGAGGFRRATTSPSRTFNIALDSQPLTSNSSTSRQAVAATQARGIPGIEGWTEERSSSCNSISAAAGSSRGSSVSDGSSSRSSWRRGKSHSTISDDDERADPKVLRRPTGAVVDTLDDQTFFTKNPRDNRSFRYVLLDNGSRSLLVSPWAPPFSSSSSASPSPLSSPSSDVANSTSVVTGAPCGSPTGKKESSRESSSGEDRASAYFSLRLLVTAGGMYDPVDAHGLANAVAACVFSRCCERGGGDVSSTSAGGVARYLPPPSFVDSQHVSYFELFMDLNDLEERMEELAGNIRNPPITEETFYKVIARLRDGTVYGSSYVGQPRLFINTEYPAAHPLDGTQLTLDLPDIVQRAKTFATSLYSADRLTVYLEGPATLDSLQELVARTFGKLKSFRVNEPKVPPMLTAAERGREFYSLGRLWSFSLEEQTWEMVNQVVFSFAVPDLRASSLFYLLKIFEPTTGLRFWLRETLIGTDRLIDISTRRSSPSEYMTDHDIAETGNLVFAFLRKLRSMSGKAWVDWAKSLDEEDAAGEAIGRIEFEKRCLQRMVDPSFADWRNLLRLNPNFGIPDPAILAEDLEKLVPANLMLLIHDPKYLPNTSRSMWFGDVRVGSAPLRAEWRNEWEAYSRGTLTLTDDEDIVMPIPPVAVFNRRVSAPLPTEDHDLGAYIDMNLSESSAVAGRASLFYRRDERPAGVRRNVAHLLISSKGLGSSGKKLLQTTLFGALLKLNVDYNSFGVFSVVAVHVGRDALHVEIDANVSSSLLKGIRGFVSQLTRAFAGRLDVNRYSSRARNAPMFSDKAVLIGADDIPRKLLLRPTYTPDDMLKVSTRESIVEIVNRFNVTKVPRQQVVESLTDVNVVWPDGPTLFHKGHVDVILSGDMTISEAQEVTNDVITLLGIRYAAEPVKNPYLRHDLSKLKNSRKTGPARYKILVRSAPAGTTAMRENSHRANNISILSRPSDQAQTAFDTIEPRCRLVIPLGRPTMENRLFSQLVGSTFWQARRELAGIFPEVTAQRLEPFGPFDGVESLVLQTEGDSHATCTGYLTHAARVSLPLLASPALRDSFRNSTTPVSSNFIDDLIAHRHATHASSRDNKSLPQTATPLLSLSSMVRYLFHWSSKDTDERTGAALKGHQTCPHTMKFRRFSELVKQLQSKPWVLIEKLSNDHEVGRGTSLPEDQTVMWEDGNAYFRVPIVYPPARVGHAALWSLTVLPAVQPTLVA